MKIWKLTLWKLNGVKEPSDLFFLASLFRWRISESMKPQNRTRRPQPCQRHQQNQRFDHRPPHLPPSSLRLAHTAYVNWFLWTSHRTLLASLSSNFLFGDIKRGRGSNSLNDWVIVRLGRTDLLKQDDAFFWLTSNVNSKSVANELHGGFINSLTKFIIIFFYYDQFVCQQWRHHNNFKDTLRTETPISSFLRLHSLICLQFINFNYTVNYSTSAIRSYGGNFKASPSWRRMPSNFCLYQHFLQKLHQE